MRYWHVIAAKMAFIIVVEVRVCSGTCVRNGGGVSDSHCLSVSRSAHRVPDEVHPVLRHPRRAVRRQGADQAGEIPDPGHPARDQPEAGDQAPEAGPRRRHQRDQSGRGHGGDGSGFLRSGHARSLVHLAADVGDSLWISC